MCDKTLTYWCVFFRISSIYVRASSFESVYAYTHLYRVSICCGVDSSLLVVLVIPLADTATARPKRYIWGLVRERFAEPAHYDRDLETRE